MVPFYIGKWKHLFHTKGEQMNSTFWDKSELKFACNKWCYNRNKALKLYGHISQWNVSDVTDMSDLFNSTEYYNNSFHSDMGYLFIQNKKDKKQINAINFKNFNDDISNWDTSNVTNMSNMFRGCEKYNQPIRFNTSKVKRMNGMFYGCTVFNQPLKIDTSKVIDMSYMFAECWHFNQPLGHMNTANVVDMSFMFYRCFAYNQPMDSNESLFKTHNVTRNEKYV